MPLGRVLPRAMLAWGSLTAMRVLAQDIPLPMPAGVAIGGNVPAAATSADACEPCPPLCRPVPRIRVIVPPPEVVFRCTDNPRRHPLHQCKPAAEPCPSAPAPCQEAGRMSFNMTLHFPMAMSASAYGNAGLSSLLGSQFGAGGLGSSGLETLLMRALIAPSAGASANGAANGADGDVEARIRRLNAGIDALSSRMDVEVSRVRQEIGSLAPALAEVLHVGNEVKKLQQRMDELERNKKGNPMGP